MNALSRLHSCRTGLFAILLAVSPTASIAESVFVEPDSPSLVVERGAGEGPAWHPKYGLLFSGDGGINRLADDGQVEPFDRAAVTNGLLSDRQGRLLRCESQNGRVTRSDGDSAITVLTDEFKGKRYNQPNDITQDSRGRIYFSDPKYGSRDDLPQKDLSGRPVEGVYRIDENGRVTRVITHEVDRPNGVLVSNDDRYLFVADNNNNQIGGARVLWRFELKPDGSVDLSSQKRLFDWGTGRGPDGMDQDRAGRIYVAAGLNAPNPPFESVDKGNRAGVYVLDVDGRLLDFMAIPRDEVTNCTLAGHQQQTLYVTAGGTLWRMQIKP